MFHLNRFRWRAEVGQATSREPHGPDAAKITNGWFSTLTMTPDLKTTERRSSLMKRVRREGTGPEQKVRKLLWATGARYRLNVEDLPGSPDIANKSLRKAVFVHGCFWHFHQECDRGQLPERNRSYWENKFKRNRSRDRQKRAALVENGYDVLVVWECELDELAEVQAKLEDFWFKTNGDD